MQDSTQIHNLLMVSIAGYVQAPFLPVGLHFDNSQKNIYPGMGGEIQPVIQLHQNVVDTHNDIIHKTASIFSPLKYIPMEPDDIKQV